MAGSILFNNPGTSLTICYFESLYSTCNALQVKGGKEIAGKAKGVLVLPGVIKAGLIVGGEYGEGALRGGGKTVSYYDISLKGAKLTKIEKK